MTGWVQWQADALSVQFILTQVGPIPLTLVGSIRADALSVQAADSLVHSG
jgi:hypothetical protein